jgi:hypothetical protein
MDARWEQQLSYLDCLSTLTLRIAGFAHIIFAVMMHRVVLVTKRMPTVFLS